MSGKGSDPRPFSVTRDEFAQRWFDTFGPKKSGLVVVRSVEDMNDEELDKVSEGDGFALGRVAD